MSVTAQSQTEQAGSTAGYTFAYVRAGDPLAKPLLIDLEREYDTRYGVEVFGEPAEVEINRYPESEFAAPYGAFLLLLEDGVPVSGGAFFRYDEHTAEFKRIWTRPDRRGRGLARVVLKELEAEAKRLGYEKIYLTTGPRQPEAVALYRGSGYTPLFDVTKSAAEVGVHPFEKPLTGIAVQSRTEIAVLPKQVPFLLPPEQRPFNSASGSAISDAVPASSKLHVAAQLPKQTSKEAALGSAESAPRAQATPAKHPSEKLRETADTSAEHSPKVVPLKHWGRWIFSAILVFLVAQLVWTFFTNPQWRWPVFAEYFFNDAVLRGLWLTLWLTAVSAVIGFVLGAVLALARLSGSGLLSSFAWTFIWFFRSVPLIVQLVVWYNLGYLFPTVGIGWPFSYDYWLVEFDTVRLISATTAAVLGLSLHQAAYSAEIIRGGLLSVDQGQIEAAKALGIPKARRFFRITLPQAARAILPNAFNEVIGLLKGTSVVFLLALPELFYTVQVIYNRNAQVIPLLLVAAVWYTIFTTVLSIAQYYIERYFARGAERELPPTPLQRTRVWFHRLIRGAETNDSSAVPRQPSSSAPAGGAA